MDYLTITPHDNLATQQIELERGMTQMGIDRYRSRLEKDVQRGAEDETAYGNTIISRCTEIVAEGIREFLRDAETGRPGRRHAAIKYLKQVDARVAAYLALKNVLRGVSKAARMQSVALQIAGSIEDEVRYAEIRKEDRGLYNYLKGEARKRDDLRNKRTTVNFLLNRFEQEWDEWPQVHRQHLGTKLIDIIIEKVGLVEVAHDKEGKNKTVVYLKPTEETRKWIEDRNTAAELLQPVYEPMVYEPQDWETPRGGGYLTRYVHPLDMVKSRNKGYREELENTDMPMVYAALNTAQRAAWSVNLFILDVISNIWDNSSTMGNIPPKYDIELPPKPHDIEENEEARKNWRIQAAKIYTENRELMSSRTQFAYALNTATKFKLFERLYFPYQMDFRGRVYAVPQFNPQGPDYMKGLLHFAEPKPLDEESAPFLAIHLANCGAFGKIDKAPLEDRVAWVYENEERIIAAARGPFDDLWWTEADSPFQFLAACNEWAGWCEHGVGYPSRLAVALDGSCSGIQHFSMALKDEIGGAAVNLTPADKPADIYSLVMERVYEQMEADASQDGDPAKRDIALQWLTFKPGRGCFKRPTMTYGYGSREYGFRDQIMTDTLRPAYRAYQKGEGSWPFEADGFQASLYMAKVIAEAVDRVVVKAAEAMEWLKDTATLVAKEGLPVHWTTPDGFPVLQAYRDLKRQRVETMINGSRVVMMMVSDLPTVDKRAQAQGISPNFVHSLDGTHLRLSVVRAAEEGMKHFALVHDSFGVHAADTPRFFTLLRETLVEMYSSVEVIDNFRSEIMEQLSPKQREKLKEVPASGTLDRTAVLESSFCFA
jgi:DNA-directed RNA polymerase, mitochondrial